jgi:hypothetical protein
MASTTEGVDDPNRGRAGDGRRLDAVVVARED